MKCCLRDYVAHIILYMKSISEIKVSLTPGMQRENGGILPSLEMNLYLYLCYSIASDYNCFIINETYKNTTFNLNFSQK